MPDGHPGAKFSIQGQPNEYKLAATKKKDSKSSAESDVFKGFNCGCDANEVAIDFFIWKFGEMIEREVGRSSGNPMTVKQG